jgi:hypothetical protein
VRVHLILDSEGSIVGFVPSDVREVNQLPQQNGSSEEVTRVEIRPFPEAGQTVHEVELPSELETLNGMELQSALLRYRIKADAARLVQRES